jgi:hypothetical protein
MTDGALKWRRHTPRAFPLFSALAWFTPYQAMKSNQTCCP